MVSYTLRRINRDLWQRVKNRADYEGRTIRFVLIELLKVYATHGFKVVATFNGKDQE